MLLISNRKIAFLIVIWFAVMQVISPLMHAHIKTDSAIQGSGMHMHVLEFQQAIDKIPTIKNSVGSLHTIGVDKALIKKLSLILPSVFAFLVFLLFLPQVRRYVKPYTSPFTPRSISLRPNSKPRAPPFL